MQKVGGRMILIGNGRVITNDDSNTFIENGCIAIEELNVNMIISMMSL